MANYLGLNFQRKLVKNRKDLRLIYGILRACDEVILSIKIFGSFGMSTKKGQ